MEIETLILTWKSSFVTQPRHFERQSYYSTAFWLLLKHRSDNKNNINGQYDPKHDEKNRFDYKSKGDIIKHITEFHRTVIIIQEPNGFIFKHKLSKEPVALKE